MKGGFFMTALLAALFCFNPQPAKGQFAIFEKVWSDFHTGYALAGYDVVAYHTRRAPVMGSPRYEVKWENYYFHFANEGNMKAFLENPAIYLPAFGGFSPVQLAEGRMVEGNPQIWLIEDNRLIIFNTQNDRVRWQMDRQRLAEMANRMWMQKTAL